MDVRPHIERGQLDIQQIDPAELSPGEFASRVKTAVEGGSTFLIVDSLNAYLQSMPGEQYLLLQMHELLSYLNQQGITTVIILGQHGLVGDMRSDIDLSYLSDTILMFRFFEAKGEVRSAISAVKSRTSAHERTIREFRLSAKGLQVGDALRDFEGVLTGLPSYKGTVDLIEIPLPDDEG
jgi:circadian clock protein KaiC